MRLCADSCGACLLVGCCGWVVNEDGVCIEACWRSALCKWGPGYGQLEQEPDNQRASMVAGWLPPMVNVMWIASAEFRSMSGASHQPIFMGDCLTIYHMYLPCLPSEWISLCVPGTIEVIADAACGREPSLA